MNLFFLKIFVRNLSRQGVFPIINIAGLSIGLTAVLLICAYIFNEFSFDKSFTHHRQIYRVNMYEAMEGKTLTGSPKAFAPAVKDEIPAVEAAVRIFLYPTIIKASNEPFKIENFCWADEDFFRLFNTPFIYGSPEEVFARHGTIALSESQAKVFFGDKNPMDETLLVDNNPLKVSAVYKDFPINSSFDGYHVIGNFMSAPSWISEPSWYDSGIETFCLLAQGKDVSIVEAGIQRLVEKNYENPVFQFRLQPLGKIHLYSKDFFYNEFISNQGDIGRVKLFVLLAVIILLVACINYMNLSTARAQKRSKDIGISKTLGEKRKEITVRLYFETGLLTLLSFFMAIVLALMLLPVFNMILKQDIQPTIFINAEFLLGMLTVYLATTFVAASYPALYLSGFAPLTIIRQTVFTKGSSHTLVRKGLSVIQFSVAVILIAWVVVIQTQMNFVKNKNLGYNVQNVIAIRIPNQSVLDALRNDYSAQESVSAVAFASGFPLSAGSGRQLFKSMDDMNNFNAEKSAGIQLSKIAPETLDLLQLKLIAGTTLPERKPDDTITSIIINRKAVEFLETTPEKMIGKRLPTIFNSNDKYLYVCGVVEDFHFQSLHETIIPYGLHNSNRQGFVNLLLKVKEGALSQQLQTYEEIFKRHYPNDLFEVGFPDLIVEKAYEKDRQTGYLVMSFSFLAILVACMGVFGLTAFMAEQRTKEIGIRKVLGASVGSIVRLFTDDYLRLLALSLVIALPIAWWIGGKYLENFAYRIALSWWMFAAAALITVVLTLLTVGWQAIKAATANPVEAIKGE